jgi:hypothetical protein
MKLEWVESQNYAPAKAYYCYWLRAYVVGYPFINRVWVVIKPDGKYLLRLVDFLGYLVVKRLPS